MVEETGSPRGKPPTCRKSLTNFITKYIHVSKNSSCLEINFIKICPEMALKYFFFKMWFYIKCIVKKSKVTNTWTVSSSTILNSVVHFQSCIFIFFYVYFSHCIERGVLYANFRFSVTFLKL